jgi:hypothetical protein
VIDRGFIVNRKATSFDIVHEIVFSEPVPEAVADEAVRTLGLDSYRNGGYFACLRPQRIGSVVSDTWYFTHARSCN